MSDVDNSSSSINTIRSNHSSKTILQLITCPICLEIFREPLQLPCQHNFCKSCLERITEDRWSRCPVCRGCYRVPFTGLGSFEVNRTIVNLIESHTTVDSKPVLQAKCALCKLDDTISVCEHCREAICCKCRRQHYDEFRKYACLKLNETQQSTESLLAKEARDIKRHEENIQHANNIADTIRRKVAEIIDNIKQEEKKLLHSVQEFETDEQRLLDEKNNRFQELQKIKIFCKNSEEILNNKEEADEEAIGIQHKCDDFVLNLHDFQNQILVMKTPQRHISFFNQDISLDAISLGFIEIRMELEPIESAIKLSSLKHQSSDKSMQSCSQKLLTYLSITSQNQKNTSNLSMSIGKKQRYSSSKKQKNTSQIVGKRGTRDTEFIYPSSLAYSKWDQLIYVCDTYNNRLVTYGIDGVLKQVLKAQTETGEKRFDHPFAIHIDSNHRIYLIDQSERRVKVFNRDFKLLRIIGQYGRETDHYLAPSDLCTNTEKDLFICDAGSHRILKYNEQGQFLLAWGELGNENGQFKCPACICTLSGDRLAVSDWGNDRIQIFNSNGNHLLSIGHRGKLLAEFSRPLGLTYDETTEKLYVCDEGNNRVMIFSHDFSLIDSVRSKTGFKGPYDILLVKDNRIIISEHRAHRLQIL